MRVSGVDVQRLAKLCLRPGCAVATEFCPAAGRHAATRGLTARCMKHGAHPRVLRAGWSLVARARQWTGSAGVTRCAGTPAAGADGHTRCSRPIRPVRLGRR
jgi:hypothetical protein